MDTQNIVAAVTKALKQQVMIERRRVDLLRKIDRAAVDEHSSLESSLKAILPIMQKTLSAQHIGVSLLIDGSQHRFSDFPFRAETPKPGPRSAIPDPQIAPQILQTGSKFSISVQIVKNCTLTFEINLTEIPIAPNLRTFLDQLKDQLKVLVLTKLDRAKHLHEKAIVETLLASSLKEPAVWHSLFNAILTYVPSWCPSRNGAKIQQFLLARHNERTMHLVAGNGSNSQSEFILMSESVTGRAAIENWQEPKIVDTEADHEKYVRYGADRLRWELVIPIVSEGQLLAVVNLESNYRETFNALLISNLQEAANFVGPILRTLVEKNIASRDSQVRIQYVMSDMLHRLGDTFGHLVSQPFLAAKLAVGELKYLLNNLPENPADIEAELTTITAAIHSIESDCTKFIDALPNFLDKGPQNVARIVKGRLEPLVKRARSMGIEFEYEFSDIDKEAFGSALFVEHVYNICFNSIQAIVEKQDSGYFEKTKPKIIVGCSSVASNRSTGVNFIAISVRDNAGGMPVEVLEKTRGKGHSTKVGGNGYAIPAAREYFNSIGGEMHFDNFRTGLRTVMKMQSYDPLHHESFKIEMETAK